MFGSGFAAFKGSNGGAPGLDLAQLIAASGGSPQVSGLFGGSRGPQPVAASPQTAAPGPAAVSGGKGPSFLRVLDGVAGGKTITEVKDAYRAAQAAQAKQQQYAQAIEGLNLDPREKIVALNDPENWMKQNATRFAFHDVAGGNTILNGPGGGQQIASKLVGDNGVYGVQDASGYHDTGQRGMSHSEVNTREKTLADIQNALDRLGLDRSQLAEMIRSHKATEGIGRMNAGTSAFSAQTGRKAYEARLKGVGGFGTPGAGLSFVPDSDVEVNP